MNVIEILTKAAVANASDVFIIAGLPLSYKVNGAIVKVGTEKMMPQDTSQLISGIYDLAEKRNMEELVKYGDDDFSFAIKGVSRFRVNTYKQRGSLAAVVRVITFTLPDPSFLGIPSEIIELTDVNKGLILVTGPAGSGKSTTQASMIDYINAKKEKHIITLEDPIEYLHSHKKSIVSQREICTDTISYVQALRAALRQSPDVILLGEMRDYETINVAMTAAETGHLVISTLHTIGAANTIDRIIDVFPANQQRQVAIQLSMVLQAVVSQQLVPSINDTLVPVFELMTVNAAIKNMIRDNKVHQIDGIIYSSSNKNMCSMDMSLIKLYKENKITEKTALTYATNPEMLVKKL